TWLPSLGLKLYPRLERYSNAFPRFPHHSAALDLPIRIHDQIKSIGRLGAIGEENARSALGNIENRAIDCEVKIGRCDLCGFQRQMTLFVSAIRHSGPLIKAYYLELVCTKG